MAEFPEITDAVLNKFRFLRQMVSEDPSVLDLPECPYDERTKAWLRVAFVKTAVTDLLAGLDGEDGAPEEIEDGDWGDIGKKSRALYKEIEELARGLSGLDTQEKIATIKARASLLERLVTIGERTTNLRLMGEFMDGTLKVLESVFTPDQRTDAIEQLRKLAGK